jgi:hypothetical protein
VPTLNVNHTEDLNSSLLKEMELTPEWSAAELLGTKIPLWERLSQLVGVTGTRRLQKHESSPVVTFLRRSTAVFRLDGSPRRDSLEEFEQKELANNAPEPQGPGWLFSEKGYPLKQKNAPASRSVSRVEELEVRRLRHERIDRLVAGFGFSRIHSPGQVAARCRRRADPTTAR